MYKRILARHDANTIQVKQCKLGWSFTNGRKWFFYAYSTKEHAQSVYDKVISTKEAWSDMRIQVNIRYDAPMELYNRGYPV